MQTLKEFLCLHKLEQYHEVFIKAGATEQDLPQFLEFNEHELNEFLSILDILPFHLIKFKKALRELKKVELKKEEDEKTQLEELEDEEIEEITNSGTSEELELSPSAVTSRDVIISHATIYGKKTNRSLTSYEEAINRASVQLALENPMLITTKGRLFEQAKKKLLDEGYHYKRGKSRSKLQTNTNSQNHQTSMLEKREMNARRQSDRRLNKIRSLQDQIEDLIERRKSSESKLENLSPGTSAYLLVEAEIVEHEENRAELLKEVSKLKAQERKHQWYKKKKLERSSSQMSSSADDENNLSFMSQDSNYSDQQQQEQPQNHHHHHYTRQNNQHHQYHRQCSNDDSGGLSSSNRSPSFLDSSQDSFTTNTTAVTAFSYLSDEGFSIPSNSNICPRESDVRASAIGR